MSFFGYEWLWECDECEKGNELSGTHFGVRPTINGEEDATRTRELEEGDEITCGSCGHTVELQFVEVEE